MAAGKPRIPGLPSGLTGLRLMAWAGMVLLSCPLAPMGAMKDVPIAHFSVDDNLSDIPDDYLAYARRNGYKYLLASLGRPAASSPPDEWKNPATGRRDGTYNFAWAGIHAGLYSELKDVFVRADRHGLKVIPVINLRSRWSGYPGTWTAMNDSIETNDGVNFDGTRLRVPSYLEDGRGFDKSVLSYLGVVKRAFDDAGLAYDLEYIHLGGDEMVFVESGELFLIPGYSNAAEKRLIGDDVERIYGLIAGAVRRDVANVKKVFPKARAIMYADMFDPQLNGASLPTYRADGSRSRPIRRVYAKVASGRAIAETRRVLDRPEIDAFVKANLILMPWMYANPLYAGNSVYLRYDAFRTLKHFASRGFQVMVAMAIEPSTDPSPGLRATHAMRREWIAAAARPEVAASVLGVAAQNFWGSDGDRYWSTTPRSRIFQVLPEIAEGCGFLPGHD